MSAPPIKAESRAYFRALGKHISQLRKEIGMTQAELARAIGVSQQAVFAYELGDRRVSVLVVTRIAKVFAISVAQLIGMEPPERRGRLSPRAIRHAERLQALSKTQQRFVVRIIDVLVEANVPRAPAAADIRNSSLCGAALLRRGKVLDRMLA